MPLVGVNGRFAGKFYFTPGRHLFKFIVNDQWHISPQFSTVADESGNLNHFFEISEANALSLAQINQQQKPSEQEVKQHEERIKQNEILAAEKRAEFAPADPRQVSPECALPNAR